MGQQQEDVGVAADEAARRQAAFREVNERIGEAFDLVAAAGEPFPIACECGNEGCLELVAVTESEYEPVRRSPARFVVAPGHELPAVERVVARNERFAVVERREAAG